MPIKLDTEKLLWTTEHICKFGDTDIFPYPFELKFIEGKKSDIANELSKLDAFQYHCLTAVESLVPKNRYGFRLAHQIYPIDLIFFSALVFQAFEKIEPIRDAVENARVFSYRFRPDEEARLFSENHRYVDWMTRVEGLAAFGEEQYSHVIETDVSDFYQRIYRHRLENIVETATENKELSGVIEKFIDHWRGKQSFGIPVGGNAARLLAEAAMSDVDQALIAEGYDFCRYVDDFVIFVKHHQDPYAALGFLAGQLFTNEGLGLNNQKTRLRTREAFFQQFEEVNAEDREAAEEAATEKLFWAAYDDDGGDPEALNKLLQQDLRKELKEELEATNWNIGKIKILLRALRLTKQGDTLAYLRRNLPDLMPFIKDVVLLIDELADDGDRTFEDAGEEICELLVSDRLRPLEAARAWLLELVVRGRVVLTAAQVRKIDGLGGTLDQRQLFLIRGAMRDVNFFRQRKARVDELPLWTQPAFIFASRCLPKDEYDHWLNSIRSRVRFPLGPLFISWCKEQHE